MMQCTSLEEECAGDSDLLFSISWTTFLVVFLLSGWFSGTMQTAQHSTSNQLESHDLVIEDCTVRRICQKSPNTFCSFFRWFMQGGCCHELEVEEGVCSTCEAMEEVEVAVA